MPRQHEPCTTASDTSILGLSWPLTYVHQAAFELQIGKVQNPANTDGQPHLQPCLHCYRTSRPTAA